MSTMYRCPKQRADEDCALYEAIGVRLIDERADGPWAITVYGRPYAQAAVASDVRSFIAGAHAGMHAEHHLLAKGERS